MSAGMRWLLRHQIVNPLRPTAGIRILHLTGLHGGTWRAASGIAGWLLSISCQIDNGRSRAATARIITHAPIVHSGRPQVRRKTGCTVGLQVEGRLSMDIHSQQIHSHEASRARERAVELDRLGDEIAELSAHVEAATARLLALIREFDARGGWNSGFRSCAAWLSWRVGLDPGAARERVRVARAQGTLPLLAEALGRGELSYAKVRALTRAQHRKRKRVCSRWGVPARPPMSSASCEAGGGSIGTRRPGRPRGSTRLVRFTSTRTRTAL
jgi:hypothetical protein